MKVARRYRLSDRERKKSRKGKSRVKKGKKGERETAAKFQEALSDLIDDEILDVARRFQGRLTGKHRPEICICVWGNYHEQLVHVENKRDESTSLEAAFLQAAADCKNGTVPVAVVKRFRKPETITLYLSDFLPMLKSWLEDQFKGV